MTPLHIVCDHRLRRLEDVDPPVPPLNFPRAFMFSTVAAGQTQTTEAGGQIRHTGSVAIVINDPSGVFAIAGYETLALQVPDDPDLPPGTPRRRVWQVVDHGNGAGPFDVSDAGAVAVELRFSCPPGPGLNVYNATVSVVPVGTTGPALLEMPVTATVPQGALNIVPLDTPPLFAGQTAVFRFRLNSTLRAPVGGTLTCDTSPPSAFSSDTSPAFPTVPSGASVDVILPVTCAAGTAAGHYNVPFRFHAIDNSREFARATVPVTVRSARVVGVTTSLSSPVTLPHANAALCEMKAVVSGGPSTFRLRPEVVPTGVILTGANQSVAVNGTVLLGVTIEIVRTAPVGKLATPLVLGWTVDGDSLHPETSGVVVLDIVVPPRRLMLGLDYFKVENCRSKGDHNDVDTLIVVVSNDRNTLPQQQVLLGDNLHAGDEVRNRLLGPFEVDDKALVTVTFTVVNSAHGDDVLRTASKIAVAVGEVLGTAGTLEELQAFGLANGELESQILGVGGTVFGILGEILGVPNSNPDCSGAVLVRSFTFKPGELAFAPETVGPVPETQSSPSECGNNPHSTVVFGFHPAS
jgi:hypothetical protein